MKFPCHTCVLTVRTEIEDNDLRSVAYFAQCHSNQKFWTNNTIFLKIQVVGGKNCNLKCVLGKSEGCTMIKQLDFSHKSCMVLLDELQKICNYIKKLFYVLTLMILLW